MKKILTINAGSSSLKTCLFSDDNIPRKDFRYNNVNSFDQLLSDLGDSVPDIIGHRIVHGGNISDQSRVIDDTEFERLSSIINLAPLHLPANLLGYFLCKKTFNVPQIACYDTSFHSTIPEINYRLPIPTPLGFRKYGFHGLNYAYVASVLPELIGKLAYKRVVVAHLGSGSSLCLMKNLKSVDTTMGYTPAGGVVMGTRSGDIDPGILIELSKTYTDRGLSKIIFKDSGLLALSNGRSSDMRELCTYPSPDGDFAINYYCNSVCGAIGSLAAKAGGIDALVFTGGIGENSDLIVNRIANQLAFLGIKEILAVNADEERTIYNLCNGYEII